MRICRRSDRETKILSCKERGTACGGEVFKLQNTEITGFAAQSSLPYDRRDAAAATERAKSSPVRRWG